MAELLVQLPEMNAPVRRQDRQQELVFVLEQQRLGNLVAGLRCGIQRLLAGSTVSVSEGFVGQMMRVQKLAQGECDSHGKLLQI